MVVCVFYSYSQAIKNVPEREIAYRDTLKAEYVNIITTDKGYKATWCGKSVNMGKEDAEKASNGASVYVIVNHYTNGEAIRFKLICKE